MKLSFRGKLTLLFFVLSLTPLAISTFYFLGIYRNDKIANLFEHELDNVIRGADHIDAMVATARSIEPAEMENSRNIIALGLNPCGPAGSSRVFQSRHFQTTMSRLGLRPDYWLNVPALKSACLARDPKNLRPLLLTGPKFPITYAYFFIPSPLGDRVTAFSLDGIGGGSEATRLLITDEAGTIQWIDGTPKTRQELESGLGETLRKFTADALEKQIPSIMPNGNHIIAAAPISARYVFLAVTNEGTALAPVRFVLNQFILLAVGWMFLYLLVGKLAAARISKPLDELRQGAARFGDGDLRTRIRVTGKDELSQVQTTFNEMADHIAKLVEDTKSKAAIESDIAIAKKLQQWFYPNKRIMVQGHELNSSIEMAQSCGGDWWGYVEVPRPDGSPLLVLMIADAVGHGVASALLTAATQGGIAVLDSWIAENPGLAADPRNILQLFNKVIFHTTRGEIHMTFFVAVMDADTETVTVANAGHNKPYLLIPKSDGKGADIKPMGGSGPVLGTNAEESFTDTQTFPWKIGHQMLLYTDGLIDCVSGDKNLFERRSLIQLLKTQGHLKRDALINMIMKERAKAVGKLKQEDDITAVVCTRLASPLKVAAALPVPPPKPRPPKPAPAAPAGAAP